MKKQTKYVAVLSAAALLAMGASMTSFAAGWEKDEAGAWHYYDKDDDMVTSEWRKDGGKWFYLDEDGAMLTDSWVDDEYYVGEDGAMLKNAWIKSLGDDEQDDPEDDGEHWYYLDSKGQKYTDDHKKINGKTYYFDSDGKMKYGWQEDNNGNVYYLGGEDEGWRAENQWLWLEKSSELEDKENPINGMAVLGCDTDDDCDDEGWYWFQADGKMYNGTAKKKIKGYYYLFNKHGQMLYQWINGTKIAGTYAMLDEKATEGSATIGEMVYYSDNGDGASDGSRVTGWRLIDGSESTKDNADTKWYYFKKGEAKHANDSDWNSTWEENDDGSLKPVFVKKEKISWDGKSGTFAFNKKGQMQTGLQFIDGKTYYFNDEGFMTTGKISNVEEGDDENYNYYFTTKNNGNGRGFSGEKDGYLYFLGKRLEADDECKLYILGGDVYLVNTKGKLQKSSSKKDTETNTGEVLEDFKPTTASTKSYKLTSATYKDSNGHTVALDIDQLKALAEVPHIQIEDTWVYNDVTGTSSSDYSVVPVQALADKDHLTPAHAHALAVVPEDADADADDAE